MCLEGLPREICLGGAGLCLWNNLDEAERDDYATGAFGRKHEAKGYLEELSATLYQTLMKVIRGDARIHFMKWLS